MIIDSHQHFWDLSQVDYEWIVPEYEPIYRNFEPDNLRHLLRAAGVDRTIIVQAANSYEETDAQLARAAANDFVAGVVGWVRLTRPAEAEEALATRYADADRLVGVRHLNHDEPDPEWLVRPEVLEGLRVIERRGLVFEVVAVHPLHLPHVPAIAAHCPELTIVVDHLGKPPIASGDIDSWKKALTSAADVETVVAKVSGLNTQADWESWDASDLVEPIGHAVEEFGVDRLMFGSDWPVAVLAGSYEKVWHETLTALDLIGLSDGEKNAVLGTTAQRIYGLEET